MTTRQLLTNFRFIRRAAVLAIALLMLATSQAHAYTKVRDLTYVRRGSVPIKADLFRPTGSYNRPIVVLVHGGGWWSGSKEQVESSAVDFVRANYIVLNINYRMACGTPTRPRMAWGYRFIKRGEPMCWGGNVTVPQQVADVRNAVIYARRNARNWGGNPRRIALVGSSAGGHLSLMAATNAPPLARVKALINWSGPTSNRIVARQNHRLAGTIKAAFTNAVGCKFDDCPDKWDAASPHYLTERKSPRFAVLNTVSQRERHVSVPMMMAYHRFVSRLGWYSRVYVARGNCHSRECLNKPIVSGARGTVRARSISFLNARL